MSVNGLIVLYDVGSTIDSATKTGLPKELPYGRHLEEPTVKIKGIGAQTDTRLSSAPQRKKPATYSIAGFSMPVRLIWWDLRGSNPRQTD